MTALFEVPPVELNALERALWYSDRLRERGIDPMTVPSADWGPVYRGEKPAPGNAGAGVPGPAPVELNIVTADEFAAREETGAEALVGADGESALIPEGGDVMFYGDGGTGKTTLAVDLACHLAAGDPWLGNPILRAANVLLIENEGPRPHFRAKLRRKLEGWAGSPLEGRLLVLERPWSMLTLAEDTHRATLAATIYAHELDLVMLGPVTRAGMNEAGTLQQVRDFTLLLADIRQRVRAATDRPVAFALIHHENKGGQVSGAWEGAGDTLLHVQGRGRGRTRLFVQKARWSSFHHATALELTWTDGEGFAVDAEPVHDDDTIAEELLAAVLANGGASWNTIEHEPNVTGNADRLKVIRDRLLKSGALVNAGSDTRFKLWHPDDPACPPIQDSFAEGTS